jgi:hypothetical protein
VARRDGSRCTPGLVDSSGCLHTGSYARILIYREVHMFLTYDCPNGISTIHKRPARPCGILLRSAGHHPEWPQTSCNRQSVSLPVPGDEHVPTVPPVSFQGRVP